MCGPVFAILGAGLSAFGAIQQGNAQAAAMRAQQQQYRAEAEFQNRQAVLEQVKGGYEARRKGEQLDELGAKQRGQFAAAGVGLSGSPTDILIDTRQEGALDLAAIRFGTDLRSDNARYQAGVASMNSASAGQAAGMARTTGFINALSPIINLGTNDKFATQLGQMF